MSPRTSPYIRPMLNIVPSHELRLAYGRQRHIYYQISAPKFCVVGSSPTRGTEHFGFPPVLRVWEIKGLGMSSLVYVTGHIKDPVPLIDKRRGLSPGGRFPPSFIHQVIIITGLTKLYNCMSSPWRWPYMPTGRKTPTQTKKKPVHTILINYRSQSSAPPPPPAPPPPMTALYTLLTYMCIPSW